MSIYTFTFWAITSHQSLVMVQLPAAWDVLSQKLGGIIKKSIIITTHHPSLVSYCIEIQWKDQNFNILIHHHWLWNWHPEWSAAGPGTRQGTALWSGGKRVGSYRVASVAPSICPLPSHTDRLQLYSTLTRAGNEPSGSFTITENAPKRQPNCMSTHRYR